jgi:hypothetical protein
MESRPAPFSRYSREEIIQQLNRVELYQDWNGPQPIPKVAVQRKQQKQLMEGFQVTPVATTSDLPTMNTYATQDLSTSTFNLTTSTTTVSKLEQLDALYSTLDSLESGALTAIRTFLNGYIGFGSPLPTTSYNAIYDENKDILSATKETSQTTEIPTTTTNVSTLVGIWNTYRNAMANMDVAGQKTTYVNRYTNLRIAYMAFVSKGRAIKPDLVDLVTTTYPEITTATDAVVSTYFKTSAPKGKFYTLIDFVRSQLQSYAIAFNTNYASLSSEQKAIIGYTDETVSDTATDADLINYINRFGGFSYAVVSDTGTTTTPTGPSPSYASQYTLGVSRQNALSVVRDFNALMVENGSLFATLDLTTDETNTYNTLLAAFGSTPLDGVTSVSSAVLDIQQDTNVSTHQGNFQGYITSLLELVGTLTTRVVSRYDTLRTKYTTVKGYISNFKALQDLPTTLPAKQATDTVPTTFAYSATGTSISFTVGGTAYATNGGVSDYTTYKTLRDKFMGYLTSLNTFLLSTTGQLTALNSEYTNQRGSRETPPALTVPATAGTGILSIYTQAGLANTSLEDHARYIVSLAIKQYDELYDANNDIMENPVKQTLPQLPLAYSALTASMYGYWVSQSDSVIASIQNFLGDYISQYDNLFTDYAAIITATKYVGTDPATTTDVAGLRGIWNNYSSERSTADGNIQSNLNEYVNQYNNLYDAYTTFQSDANITGLGISLAPLAASYATKPTNTVSTTTVQSYFTQSTGTFYMMLTFVQGQLSSFLQEFGNRYNALTDRQKQASPYTPVIIPANYTSYDLVYVMNQFGGYNYPTVGGLATGPGPAPSISTQYQLSVSRQNALNVVDDFNTLVGENGILEYVFESADQSTYNTLVAAIDSTEITRVVDEIMANTNVSTHQSNYTGHITSLLSFVSGNLTNLMNRYETLRTRYEEVRTNVARFKDIPALTVAAKGSDAVTTPVYVPVADATHPSVGTNGGLSGYSAYTGLRSKYDGLITSLLSAVNTNLGTLNTEYGTRRTNSSATTKPDTLIVPAALSGSPTLLARYQKADDYITSLESHATNIAELVVRNYDALFTANADLLTGQTKQTLPTFPLSYSSALATTVENFTTYATSLYTTLRDSLDMNTTGILQKYVNLHSTYTDFLANVYPRYVNTVAPTLNAAFPTPPLTDALAGTTYTDANVTKLNGVRLKYGTDGAVDSVTPTAPIQNALRKLKYVVQQTVNTFVGAYEGERGAKAPSTRTIKDYTARTGELTDSSVTAATLVSIMGSYGAYTTQLEAAIGRDAVLDRMDEFNNDLYLPNALILINDATLTTINEQMDKLLEDIGTVTNAEDDAAIVGTLQITYTNSRDSLFTKVVADLKSHLATYDTLASDYEAFRTKFGNFGGNPQTVVKPDVTDRDALDSLTSYSSDAVATINTVRDSLQEQLAELVLRIVQKYQLVTNAYNLRNDALTLEDKDALFGQDELEMSQEAIDAIRNGDFSVLFGKRAAVSTMINTTLPSRIVGLYRLVYGYLKTYIPAYVASYTDPVESGSYGDQYTAYKSATEGLYSQVAASVNGKKQKYNELRSRYSAFLDEKKAEIDATDSTLMETLANFPDTSAEADVTTTYGETAIASLSAAKNKYGLEKATTGSIAETRTNLLPKLLRFAADNMANYVGNYRDVYASPSSSLFRESEVALSPTSRPAAALQTLSATNVSVSNITGLMDDYAGYTRRLTSSDLRMEAYQAIYDYMNLYTKFNTLLLKDDPIPELYNDIPIKYFTPAGIVASFRIADNTTLEQVKGDYTTGYSTLLGNIRPRIVGNTGIIKTFKARYDPYDTDTLLRISLASFSLPDALETVTLNLKITADLTKTSVEDLERIQNDYIHPTTGLDALLTSTLTTLKERIKAFVQGKITAFKSDYLNPDAQALLYLEGTVPEDDLKKENVVGTDGNGGYVKTDTDAITANSDTDHTLASFATLNGPDGLQVKYAGLAGKLLAAIGSLGVTLSLRTYAKAVASTYYYNLYKDRDYLFHTKALVEEGLVLSSTTQTATALFDGPSSIFTVGTELAFQPSYLSTSRDQDLIDLYHKFRDPAETSAISQSISSGSVGEYYTALIADIRAGIVKIIERYKALYTSFDEPADGSPSKIDIPGKSVPEAIATATLYNTPDDNIAEVNLSSTNLQRLKIIQNSYWDSPGGLISVLDSYAQSGGQTLGKRTNALTAMSHFIGVYNKFKDRIFVPIEVYTGPSPASLAPGVANTSCTGLNAVNTSNLSETSLDRIADHQTYIDTNGRATAAFNAKEDGELEGLKTTFEAGTAALLKDAKKGMETIIQQFQNKKAANQSLLDLPGKQDVVDALLRTYTYNADLSTVCAYATTYADRVTTTNGLQDMVDRYFNPDSLKGSLGLTLLLQNAIESLSTTKGLRQTSYSNILTYVEYVANFSMLLPADFFTANQYAKMLSYYWTDSTGIAEFQGLTDTSLNAFLGKYDGPTSEAYQDLLEILQSSLNSVLGEFYGDYTSADTQILLGLTGVSIPTRLLTYPLADASTTSTMSFANILIQYDLLYGSDSVLASLAATKTSLLATYQSRVYGTVSSFSSQYSANQDLLAMSGVQISSALQSAINDYPGILSRLDTTKVTTYTPTELQGIDSRYTSRIADLQAKTGTLGQTRTLRGDVNMAIQTYHGLYTTFRDSTLNISTLPTGYPTDSTVLAYLRIPLENAYPSLSQATFGDFITVASYFTLSGGIYSATAAFLAIEDNDMLQGIKTSFSAGGEAYSRLLSDIRTSMRNKIVLFNTLYSDPESQDELDIAREQGKIAASIATVADVNAFSASGTGTDYVTAGTATKEVLLGLQTTYYDPQTGYFKLYQDAFSVGDATGEARKLCDGEITAFRANYTPFKDRLFLREGADANLDAAAPPNTSPATLVALIRTLKTNVAGIETDSATYKQKTPAEIGIIKGNFAQGKLRMFSNVQSELTKTITAFFTDRDSSETQGLFQTSGIATDSVSNLVKTAQLGLVSGASSASALEAIMNNYYSSQQGSRGLIDTLADLKVQARIAIARTAAIDAMRTYYSTYTRYRNELGSYSSEELIYARNTNVGNTFTITANSVSGYNDIQSRYEDALVTLRGAIAGEMGTAIGQYKEVLGKYNTFDQRNSATTTYDPAPAPSNMVQLAADTDASLVRGPTPGLDELNRLQMNYTASDSVFSRFKSFVQGQLQEYIPAFSTKYSAVYAAPKASTYLPAKSYTPDADLAVVRGPTASAPSLVGMLGKYDGLTESTLRLGNRMAALSAMMEFITLYDDLIPSVVPASSTAPKREELSRYFVPANAQPTTAEFDGYQAAILGGLANEYAGATQTLKSELRGGIVPVWNQFRKIYTPSGVSTTDPLDAMYAAVQRGVNAIDYVIDNLDVLPLMKEYIRTYETNRTYLEYRDILRAEPSKTDKDPVRRTLLEERCAATDAFFRGGR